MNPVGIPCWRLFPLASEKGEDGAIACKGFLASDSIIDSILAKTAKGVMLQIGSRRFILRVLKATNATCAYFALGSGTSEKVAGSIVVVLKGNVGLEE